MPPHPPAVLDIQHEHSLINAGLRRILDGWSEFHVLPADSLSGLSHAADVVVLDDHVAFQRRHPMMPGGPNTLVVSTMGEDANVRGALEAGVLGYVSASCSADELRMAVRVVAAGRRYLCSTASLCMADSFALPALTARESEVLALVSRGRNNKEVARLLEVSVGTVKSHVRALLSKLGAQCRTEAMWIASQRGLIPRLERHSTPVWSMPNLPGSDGLAPARPLSHKASSRSMGAAAWAPHRRLSASTSFDVAGTAN